MNLISVIVLTLEQHCFKVYAALIVCFVAFTYCNNNRAQRIPTTPKTTRKVRYGSHRRVLRVEGVCIPRDTCVRNLGLWIDEYLKFDRHVQIKIERDFSDDGDEDPDHLIPALPEDTGHIPYKPERRTDEEILERSRAYYELMAIRRTVRSFSQDPIPQEVIDNLIKTAGTSPSGAHTEPWTFVVVQDPETKSAIKCIVEEEEDLNYSKRMSRQWVTDLKPFATKPVKPYLEEAPVLLLIFRQMYSWRPDGKKRMHYYSEISTAIAAGFLLAAVQYCGLVALTSTPLNCNARIRDLLCRPSNEKLELLLPVGRAHEHATVPDLHRKNLEQIMVKI